MFKSINSKKLIANTLLAGIIVTGGFVIDSNQNKVQAASCGDNNNGHGNDSGLSSNLDINSITHTITVDNFDPDNPGNKRSQLISGLENGATRTNGMDITYSHGSFYLTNPQADYVVTHLSADESCISDETTAESSGTIYPSSFIKDTAVAEIVELERTVTLDLSALATPSETAAPSKLDVLFIADNSGTMTNPINDVITEALGLLTTLDSTYQELQVGVAFYRGDPEEYGNPGDVFEVDPDGIHSRLIATGVAETYTRTYTRTGDCGDNGWKTQYLRTVTNASGEIVSEREICRENSQLNGHSVSWSEAPEEHKAYQLLEPVNGGTIDDAMLAIQAWESHYESENNGYPEGNFFALHQAATSGDAVSGYSTGYDTQWREDADKKIIVLFGDAKSITSTIGLTETINALNANNITVVAIGVQDSATPAGHLFNVSEQFYSSDENTTTITRATGGIYADANGTAMTETMLNLIGTTAVVTTYTTPTIDINFSTVQDPLLPLGNFVNDTCTDPNGCVKYECIDPAGCLQVGHGESRLFKMTFQGNIPEDYIFNTVVVDGSGNNIDGAVSNNDLTIYGVD